VFEGDREPLLQAANLRISEDDQGLIAGITANPYAVGLSSYALFRESDHSVRSLSLDGVGLDAGLVAAGRYPLARPYYLYTDAKTLAQRPQLAAFLNFYLTHGQDEMLQRGLFPVSTEALNEAKLAYLSLTR